MQPSVIYRAGPLTAVDYDEAIEALQDAKQQLEPDPRGCLVCGSEEHSAQDCRHNPLVMARRGVDAVANEHWRCFHCGDVFALGQEKEAREHFGPSSEPYQPPLCHREVPA